MPDDAALLLHPLGLDVHTQKFLAFENWALRKEYTNNSNSKREGLRLRKKRVKMSM